MEVLLAGACEQAPLPITELVGPELLEQLPDNTAELLTLLPEADLYLQDEVEFALHPTLTRHWMRSGRRNQILIEAPGDNRKVHGFGLVDWRDGWFNGLLAPSRAAQPFREQLEAAVSRSQSRGRIAIVMCDNARTHTPEGSLAVRSLLREHAGKLYIVYTPKYDPESNRIEWLWRSSRKEVTHNHTRAEFRLLLEDVEAHFQRLRDEPQSVLRQIGSPHAIDDQADTELELAA